jgi:benzoate 4-monooxygenase
MYMLASHPEKQQKLYETLLEALSDDCRPIAPYSELSRIPFLRACLDETFRLLPPVRFGLPRRTVTDGATISGEFIPAGVTVSSSVYTLHRDASLFHSPLEWKPERWIPDNDDISEDERRNLKDYVLAFTLGGRACIGRNLAYMELSVCLAALVMSFEWTISKEAKEGFTHYERFNSSPVSLIISAKPRPGMVERL